jgi:prepilin-type N-terminal cleavage/methylation domain-containing protein
MTEEKNEGFTLIELLVVMIIIGILAAIAIPVFLNQQKKGYDASVKSDLRTVANELNTYYTDNQTYASATFGASTAGAGTTTTPLTAVTSGTTAVIGSDTITLSKGTTVYVAGAGTKGFCLIGINSNGSANAYYGYDSTKGGLITATGTTVAAAAAAACTGSY